MEHARELVEARSILRRRGIEAGLIEPAGDPAQTIERLAQERGYDTIVVGGNRAGRNGHPWMESVTAHVAANAVRTSSSPAACSLRPRTRTSDGPRVGPVVGSRLAHRVAAISASSCARPYPVAPRSNPLAW